MKTLRRLLLSVAGAGASLGVADARRHQLVLRRRRRHGLRPLPRDPAHGRRLGGLEPPRREAARTATAAPSRPTCACTRRTSQRVWLHSRGETPEQIHIRHQDVAAARRALRRPATARSAPTGRAGPTGRRTRRIFINPEHNANQQLMDDCLRCHAHALRGRHPRPRDPARPQGAVDVRERGGRRAARRALPRLPLGPPQGRAARRRAATARLVAGPAQEIVAALARPLRPARARARRPRPAAAAGDEGRASGR